MKYFTLDWPAYGTSPACDAFRIIPLRWSRDKMNELSVILIIWGMCCVVLCYGKSINRFWFRLLSDPLRWLSSVLRPPPRCLTRAFTAWENLDTLSILIWIRSYLFPITTSPPAPPPFPSQSYSRPGHTAEIPPQPSVWTHTCQRGNGTSNRISKTLALFSGMPNNFTISLFVWQSVQIKHPFFPLLPRSKSSLPPLHCCIKQEIRTNLWPSCTPVSLFSVGTYSLPVKRLQWKTLYCFSVSFIGSAGKEGRS